MNIHWIQHIIEPQRLYLTWMPRPPAERRRYTVAELKRSGEEVSLHYCVDSLEYQKAIDLGFEGYPGLLLENSAHEKVLDVFMRRLPPRERRDFGKYLEAIRLPQNSQFSDFALLGYSGAKLPDDNFDIIHPFENVEGPCELLTKIAGFRYYDGVKEIENIQIGMVAQLATEPNNPNDSHAVQVLLNGTHLGYINRVQAPSIGSWIQKKRKISTFIERKNGTLESPQVYLFIAVD